MSPNVLRGRLCDHLSVIDSDPLCHHLDFYSDFSSQSSVLYLFGPSNDPFPDPFLRASDSDPFGLLSVLYFDLLGLSKGLGLLGSSSSHRHHDSCYHDLTGCLSPGFPSESFYSSGWESSSGLLRLSPSWLMS